MKIWVLFFLLLICCSQRDRARNFLDWPDSGAPSIEPFEPNPCQENVLDSDFYNCGSCGNICSAYYTDICIEGVCQCGENPPCTGVSRCISGRCFEPAESEECDNSSDCVRGSCVDGRCLDTCEFDGVCPSGYFCIAGICTFTSCQPEQCDGVDNDCDGEVDAINGRPLSEFCYSGPNINNISLPCQKGVRLCVDGEWSECKDEVPPVVEQGLLGCDGIDNDCDGCVDGILSGDNCISRQPTAFDVVYLIDISGSMESVILAVVTATNNFSSAFAGNPAFQFGIVTIPEVEPRAGLHTDLTDFTSFSTALTTIETLGGEEPQWDAVYEITTGEIPVSWRPGSTRIIILFTDEEGQSYRSRRSGLTDITESDMCSVLTRGEVLATVTTPEFSIDFDDCGFIFPLSEDVVEMTSNLNMIIDDPCQ